MVTNPNGWFRTLAGATALWGTANASAHADTEFGVVGSPIDLSANVSEAKTGLVGDDVAHREAWPSAPSSSSSG